jgi:hypothetical protein
MDYIAPRLRALRPAQLSCVDGSSAQNNFTCVTGPAVGTECAVGTGAIIDQHHACFDGTQAIGSEFSCLSGNTAGGQANPCEVGTDAQTSGCRLGNGPI